MVTLCALFLVLVGQTPSGFLPVDEAASQSLSHDYFNSAGLPKAVHERLVKRVKFDAKNSDAFGKALEARSALAKSAFAKLPEAKKTALRLQLLRSSGIGCLRYAEIHPLLKTTAAQKRTITRLQAEGNKQAMGGGPVDARSQYEGLVARLKLGQRLRGALTSGQQATLAKFLGGEAYLTGFGGGMYLFNDAFHYDGGVGFPKIGAALGFSAARCKEIADEVSRLSRTDGVEANRYLNTIEQGLSAAQRARLDELQLQVRGPIAILRGEVASRLAISAQQMEEISLSTLKISSDRAAKSLARSRSKLPARVADDLETHRLLGEAILGKLTPAQRSQWTKLKGTLVPGITRAEVAMAMPKK